MRKKPEISITNAISGRIPPQSEELEKLVLGIVIFDNSSYYRVSEMLREDSFYFPNNAQIWKIIGELFLNNQPVDAFTIVNKLKETGTFATTLSKEYIFDIQDNVVNSVDLEKYARIIEDKAIKRRMIKIFVEQTVALYGDEVDVKTIIIETDAQMIDAQRALMAYKNISSLHIGEKARQQLLLGMEKGGVVGIPTGLDSLDKLLGGLRPGLVYTIGARTRMGKSAVAAVFAYNGACMDNPSEIFSMEMPDVQLFNRMASIRIRDNGGYIPYSRIDKAEITTDEYKLVDQAIRDIQDLNKIFIDDTPHLSALSLKAKIIKAIKDYGIKAVYIDYIQIADIDTKTGNNRATAISEFMTQLKAIAMELQIPVVILSQVDRASEKGEGKIGRPKLSDLKDSAGIEEKSDVVILITRPEVVLGSDGTDAEGRSVKGIMYIDVVKNKMGETGEIVENFDVRSNSFGEALLDQLFADYIIVEEPEANPSNFYKIGQGNTEFLDNQPVTFD